MRTPASVTRLAIKSSPVSARLPSIAIDAVVHAAHALSPSSRMTTNTLAMAARVASVERSACCSRTGSWVEQALAPAVPGALEQAPFVEAVRRGRSRIRSCRGDAEARPARRARHVVAARTCAACRRSGARRSRGRQAVATGPRPRRRARFPAAAAEIGVGLGVADLLDAALDPHLAAERLPVEDSRRRMGLARSSLPLRLSRWVKKTNPRGSWRLQQHHPHRRAALRRRHWRSAIASGSLGSLALASANQLSNKAKGSSAMPSRV